MDAEKVTYTVFDAKGNSRIADGPAVVVEVSPYAVMRFEKMGDLLLCDECTRYEWRCRTESETGTTICTKVCVQWNCRSVPAAAEIQELWR